MSETPAEKIERMVQADLELRSKLIENGVLWDGYHPEMEALHNRNAEELSEILETHGWPTEDVAGAKAAEGAWLIVQHAIGQPDFLRQCLLVMTLNPKVPRSHCAYLEDRILVFEGRPQVYGTQHDWNESGFMSPSPIQNPEGVDERRAKVRLPPLAETTARLQNEAWENGERPPINSKEKKMRFEEWAKRTGWR